VGTLSKLKVSLTCQPISVMSVCGNNFKAQNNINLVSDLCLSVGTLSKLKVSLIWQAVCLSVGTLSRLIIHIYRELESENLSLQEEYQHLKASSSSPTTAGSGSGSNPHSSSSSSGITSAPTNGSSFLMSVPALSSDAEILQVW